MSNRGGRWGRLALCVGAAILVGAGTGALVNAATGDDGRSGASTSDGASIGEDTSDGDGASETSANRAEAPPTTEPSDRNASEDVEVVETGLTATHQQRCLNSSDADPSDGCSGCSVADGCGTRPPDEVDLVSYGMIVRNNGDALLERVPVNTVFRDAAGDEVPYDGETRMEISRLLPGEEVGIGNIVTVDGPGAVELEVEVRDLDAGRVMSVDYAKAMGDVAGVCEVSAHDVTVIGFGDNARQDEPAVWAVNAKVRVALDEGVASGPLLVGEPPGVSAAPQVIYRDGEGRIVGGTSGSPMEVLPAAVPSDRTSPTPLDLLETDNEGIHFPTMDDDRTEVYFSDLMVE